MLKKNQNLILAGAILLFLIAMPAGLLLAQNVDDDLINRNQYFSPDQIDRANRIVEFLSAPEVVYSVLVSFSLLVVFATYFIVVGLMVVLFFGNFL